MPAVPPQGRAKARQFADAFTTAGLAFGVVGPIAGPVAPALGLMAALSGVLAWKANRLAQDPVDPRYRQPVAVSPSGLRIRTFPLDREHHVFAHTAAAMHRAQRELGATIDAFERAQGAALASDRSAELDRLAETRAHAERSASALDDLWYELHILQGMRPELQRLAQGTSPAIEMSDATRALAYVAGVPIADFERGVGLLRDISVVAQDPANAVESALLPTDELAQFLRDWSPVVTA